MRWLKLWLDHFDCVLEGLVCSWRKNKSKGQEILIFSAWKGFWPSNQNNWLVHLLHLKNKTKQKNLLSTDPLITTSLLPSRPPARLLFAIKGEKRFASASPPCLSGSWVPNETRRCLTASFRAGRQAGCQRSMLLAKVDEKKGVALMSQITNGARMALHNHTKRCDLSTPRCRTFRLSQIKRHTYCVHMHLFFFSKWGTNTSFIFSFS